MATAIEICNIALSHLGDTATVTSIDPPEGSAQAEHCARFYPIARDAVLQAHPWSFATRRAALVLTANVNDQWAYVYALPNLMMQAIAVIPPNADNDYNIPASEGYDALINGTTLLNTTGAYAPQPYAIETLADGTRVICTNQEDAVLRYTVYVTDTVIFPPLFVMALTWLLASMLAGPIIKGDVGAAEAKRCYQMFHVHHESAKSHDSRQRKTGMNHFVDWISGR
jgi:hypothetical protein